MMMMMMMMYGHIFFQLVNSINFDLEIMLLLSLARASFAQYDGTDRAQAQIMP